MAGVRTKPKSGKYIGWFTNARGKQTFFAGTSSKKETLKMAQQLEDQHRLIRLGVIPPPHSSDKQKLSSFDEVANEYLEWGNAQGGRRKGPWGGTHARMRESQMLFWKTELGLETIADLEGILARVEKILRNKKQQGLSGKTLMNYAGTLHHFINWCIQRGFLRDDPLKGFQGFDKQPLTRRRAMSPEEVKRLLNAAPNYRRLLYETAFSSGLRANELKCLQVENLDTKRMGLTLDARWTKNRKAGFQPLPEKLVGRLVEFAESGEAMELYERHFDRKLANPENIPENPLLYVTSHPARTFDVDLQAAGIPKETSEGKIDFHACRLAYINFVINSGASVKEAQELARHSNPDITMNVYGRTTPERLSRAVEAVGDMIDTEPDD